MTPFRRQPEPAFWGKHERRWLYDPPEKKTRPLHDWADEPTPGAGRKKLASCFLELVRAEGEPPRCAYCDGPLETVSAETIDHFIPQHACRQLALTWSNLYPSCNNCNSTYKGKRWSCRLVRPDVDPVEAMFDFEPETGRLAPAPELDSRNRARVRMTIIVYGLNTKERCAERLSILRHLENALVNDRDLLMGMVQHGPHRYIARIFVAAKRIRIG